MAAVKQNININIKNKNTAIVQSEPKKKGLSGVMIAIIVISVIILGFIVLAVGGVALMFLLGGDGTIQSYEDNIISVEMPTGSDWEEGGVTGVNDFFTMNFEEGRSYALNYYGPEDLDKYEPDFVQYLHMASCLNDLTCSITDQYETPAENTVFFVICKEHEDEYLGPVQKCAASAECGGEIFVISVTQDLSYKSSLPMDEFNAVVESARCK